QPLDRPARVGPHRPSGKTDYPPGCTPRFWYHLQEARWYDRLRLLGGSPMHTSASPRHPLMGRRTFLQAGTIGAFGLSRTAVASLRGAAPAGAGGGPRAVIFLFLTGGASQHDTFDMKPHGPADFKGEFNPIATRTPGVQICEHLPLLAQRSRHWALVRS